MWETKFTDDNDKTLLYVVSCNLKYYRYHSTPKGMRPSQMTTSRLQTALVANQTVVMGRCSVQSPQLTCSTSSYFSSYNIRTKCQLYNDYTISILQLKCVVGKMPQDSLPITVVYDG